jgi:hypothetical protein
MPATALRSTSQGARRWLVEHDLLPRGWRYCPATDWSKITDDEHLVGVRHHHPRDAIGAALGDAVLAEIAEMPVRGVRQRVLRRQGTGAACAVGWNAADAPTNWCWRRTRRDCR